MKVPNIACSISVRAHDYSLKKMMKTDAIDIEMWQLRKNVD